MDFGALAAERASAARLMMTIAQILKHVDGTHPVRFLIAETETGYTLLAALWLAQHFGIGDRVEITPLFETASALEQGVHVIEDALRSPHWRAYLKRTGAWWCSSATRIRGAMSASSPPRSGSSGCASASSHR